MTLINSGGKNMSYFLRHWKLPLAIGASLFFLGMIALAKGGFLFNDKNKCSRTLLRQIESPDKNWVAYLSLEICANEPIFPPYSAHTIRLKQNTKINDELIFSIDDSDRDLPKFFWISNNKLQIQLSKSQELQPSIKNNRIQNIDIAYQYENAVINRINGIEIPKE